MLYLNHAATSHPKPESVYQAVDTCLRGKCNGNGRSNADLDADRLVYQTRERIATLLNIPQSARIVLTSSGTESLNVALFGLLSPGDHVITTSMEHNAVTRSLHYLRTSRAVTVTKIPCSPEGELDPQDIRRVIQSKTKLIVITHASNVTGTILPIQEVGQIAKEHSILFLVDAAQTVGHLRIDVKNTGIDLLAFPGHKGLFGPPGTGGLYIAEGINFRPLKYGGTGSHSDLDTIPESLPDKYEAGTPNLPGIAGLKAGVEFILQTGLELIRRHELHLTELFLEKVVELDEIQIYGSQEPFHRVATVSLNITGCDPLEVAQALQEVYGIICRPGLHCAPDAHKTIGTFPQGTLRFSFGYSNTAEEVDALVTALSQIIEVMKPAKILSFAS